MEFLIKISNDGLEFDFIGSDIKEDETYFSAINASLFGGDCFYNAFREHKTDNSFFEALNKPVNVDNLKNAEIIAKRFLKWLLDEGLASSIEVFAFGDKDAKINVEIKIEEIK